MHYCADSVIHSQHFKSSVHSEWLINTFSISERINLYEFWRNTVLFISGGVFIVIFVGIGLACITLAFEYWWYKYKKNPRVLDTTVVHVREQPPNKETLQFNPRYNYQTDFR